MSAGEVQEVIEAIKSAAEPSVAAYYAMAVRAVVVQAIICGVLSVACTILCLRGAFKCCKIARDKIAENWFSSDKIEVWVGFGICVVASVGAFVGLCYSVYLLTNTEYVAVTRILSVVVPGGG